ncbi:MAG: mandelate racemase/muconate lactonizing enzyme family protein [Acidimicrobiales bacterium]
MHENASTITHIRAAKVRDPTALGRPKLAPAAWHTDIDHMNPLGIDLHYVGKGSDLAPPWGELVCVARSASGEFGLGMTSNAGPVLPVINDLLAQVVIGRDVHHVESIWDSMLRSCAANIGAEGLASHAMSAVDLALWDLRGKVEDQSVVDRIGGARADSLPCYATTPYAQAALDAGFEAVKLPTPWSGDADSSIDRVVEAVEAARHTMGAGTLMLDGWAVMDLEHATAIGRAVAPYGLRWLEDALMPADVDAYSELATRLPHLEIAAGERWYTTNPFERALGRSAPHVLQPDVQWVGGATPLVRIGRAASKAGRTLSIHCAANDNYGQHLAFGLPGDDLAELYVHGDDLDDPAGWRSLSGTVASIGGRITPPGGPGFGIELFLDDIERAVR